MPKINPPKIIHGEVIIKHYPKNEALKKEVMNLKNLNETSAGLKAQELDKADGVRDGKISASVWNKYAKEHGGNTIKNEISVNDAMNSITNYEVRNAKNKVTEKKITLENKNDDGTNQAPDMGL